MHSTLSLQSESLGNTTTQVPKADISNANLQPRVRDDVAWIAV